MASNHTTRDTTKLSGFITLSKPRILVMVVLMTAAGYFLAAKTIDPFDTFVITLSRYSL